MFALVLAALLLTADKEPALDPSKVPDTQKAEIAKELLEKIKDSLKKLEKSTKESRANKDAIKLNCVSDKMNQAKGLQAVAETSEKTLKEALANKDKEVIAHEFDKLAMAGQKVTQLKAESNTCIGELNVYAGDTVLIVEFEGKEGEDPTALVYVVPFLPRPVQVSPYQ
ncbi:MAG: hypothetical protein IT381_13510 [Deltaproteobacteria bacterium]|nr:hypothetical protein [Deltaproteobacteria bacterium]